MEQYKFSDLGFVMPDFDFDSSNALVSVTNPCFEMVRIHFDPVDVFDRLSSAVSAQDTVETKRQLGFFRGAIMQCGRLPDEIVLNRPVGPLIETLLRSGPPEVHYDALCALLTWTGAQNADADFYSSDGMMAYLIETSVVALSSPTYSGDRRTGRAAVGVLRNLLFHSNECRTQFLRRRGLDLFCTLYFEIDRKDQNNERLWRTIILAIRNTTLAMRGDDVPPIEVFDPILELLGHVFGYNIASAEPTEMGLASAYVDCGKIFALKLLRDLQVESLSASFSRMARDTQVHALELLKKLVCYDHEVAQVAAPRVHWKWISKFIPESCDKKVQKKYCEVVRAVFETYQSNTSCSVLSDLFPGVFGLVENQPLKVRIMAVETISTMVRSNAPFVLDVIVGHGIISKVATFLESGWLRLIRLGVDMLLYAVQYALDGRCRGRIMQEIDENEIGPLMDEVWSNESIPDDTRELLDLLRAKITELFQCPPDDGESDESYEEEHVEPMVYTFVEEVEHTPAPEEVVSEYESSDSVEWEEA